MKKDVKFEEVLLSLGQEMTNLLVKRGSSFEDAEDAVSQTYLTIFSILPEITQDNLRPWFFRVSFNNYINIYRKKEGSRGSFITTMFFNQTFQKNTRNYLN